MGQRVFELRDFIRSGQFIALYGHHLLYKEISIQMHQIIRRFVTAALACLPIDELWGEGRRFSRRMSLEGVNTIADFANMERVRVR